jgi:sec-independent protein translocase protein TatC
MRAAPAPVMPMVDHLEELRHRLFWVVGCIVLASAAALFVVFTVPVIRLLELPIQSYLPNHKLAFTHPTDPFDISMHAAIAFGIVASLPVILWHAWAFVQPAMTRQERRLSRAAVVAAVVLFACGVALAWGVVLPLAVRWLMALQSDALTPVITARDYFAFALDMAFAFGLSFQLPIVLIGLAWAELVTPDALARHRKAALFISVLVGALLTPGDLVWTTLAMAVPLYGLYELSVIGAQRILRWKQ